MRRLNWSNRSIRDLKTIRGRIAKDNPYAASRVVAKIEAAGESLSSFPERGVLVADGLRRLATVSPYLIFYRVSDEAVSIVHIRHAARRPLP